jgi:transcriptional regulator with XRE-family HTH domain
MDLRFDEIGQRLRAYRLASGLSAEEVAHSIGISRTALYRFERGELAKIETLGRLAELLNVSIPTLLGVGIEYVSTAIAYFERTRQIEEQAEQIVVLAGPLSYLLASDQFDSILRDILRESVPVDLPEYEKVLADIPQILGILSARKEAYQRRRPAITNLVSGLEIERLLRSGFTGTAFLPPDIRQQRRELARLEVKHLVGLLVKEPIGVQIGVVPDALPQTGFQMFRLPSRKILTLSPYRLGEHPNVRVGVSMITSAPESLALHERTVDQMRSRALSGEAASEYLRSLMEAVLESSDVEGHHGASGPTPKLVHRSVTSPATADSSKRVRQK